MLDYVLNYKPRLMFIVPCLIQITVSMWLNSLPEETASEVAAGTSPVQTSDTHCQTEN